MHHGPGLATFWTAAHQNWADFFIEVLLHPFKNKETVEKTPIYAHLTNALPGTSVVA